MSDITNTKIHPDYKIIVCLTPEDKNANADSITDYYKVRQKAFSDKWGAGQDVFYGKYPTEHDSRNETIFLIFKGIDPASGREEVFGGRRLVFPTPLPLEGKHKVIDRKRADRFPSLVGKDALYVDDIIPALKNVQDSTVKDLRFAELGGFAIDQDVTRRLFKEKSAYVEMRNKIYKASLEAACKAGVDIVVIGPGLSNLEHQLEWLNKDAKYEFMRLGKTRDLFSNPLPKGNESEILLINVSGKFSLRDEASILRYNQIAAEAMRRQRNAVQSR